MTTIPVEPHIVYLAHESPGRSRFRVSWLRDERVSADAIADALSKEHGVREVQVRPFTTSVLVLYDPRRTDAAAVRRAVCAATGVEEVTRPGQETPEQIRQILHGSQVTGSVLAQVAAKAFHGIHVDFLQLTAGRVSLGMAATLALWAGAVTKIVNARDIPLPEWHQMVWWGFRSFTELEAEAIESAHTGSDDVDADADADAAD